jgi:hypothetical protein
MYLLIYSLFSKELYDWSNFVIQFLKTKIREKGQIIPFWGSEGNRRERSQGLGDKLVFILNCNVTNSFNKCISHYELTKFWPSTQKCEYQSIWNEQRKESFDFWFSIWHHVSNIMTIASKHPKFPTSIKNLFDNQSTSKSIIKPNKN